MTDPRPAPYPADTRAKGWRFELDLEQVRQSTTWARAKPDVRPWLLMLWAVSWEQVPCGSLPDDREAIAGLLGIPGQMWLKHADALMRGWWPASDGRLYHDTLSTRVAEMMARRRSDSDRQAAKRAREAAERERQAAESQKTPNAVTPESRVTPTGLKPESSTDNRQPTREVSKPSASHPPGGGLQAGFAEFWKAWPKSESKQDKAKCAAFWKLRQLDTVKAQILADVRVKRATEKWQGGFIEAPLVYLRGRRWEDGVTPNAAGDHDDLGDWRRDRKTVEAKGIAVGLGKWDQDGFERGRHRESFMAYEERVAARVLELEGQPA